MCFNDQSIHAGQSKIKSNTQAAIYTIVPPCQKVLIYNALHCRDPNFQAKKQHAYVQNMQTSNMAALQQAGHGSELGQCQKTTKQVRSSIPQTPLLTQGKAHTVWAYNQYWGEGCSYIHTMAHSNNMGNNTRWASAKCSKDYMLAESTEPCRTQKLMLPTASEQVFTLATSTEGPGIQRSSSNDGTAEYYWNRVAALKGFTAGRYQFSMMDCAILL